MGNVRSCAGPATTSRPMHNLSLRTTLCQRSRRGRRAAPPAHSVWPVRPPLSARSRSPSCRVTSRYRNGDNPASAQLSPELCFATFSITRTNSTGRSHSGLATSAPRPSHRRDVPIAGAHGSSQRWGRAQTVSLASASVGHGSSRGRHAAHAYDSPGAGQRRRPGHRHFIRPSIDSARMLRLGGHQRSGGSRCLVGGSSPWSPTRARICYSATRPAACSTRRSSQGRGHSSGCDATRRRDPVAAPQATVRVGVCADRDGVPRHRRAARTQDSYHLERYGP